MDFSELIKTGRKRPLWQPGPTTYDVSYGRADIERILPHRDPFLLLDTITAIDLQQQSISGQRRIAPDDPIFAGHFPDDPIYPGVLQAEIIGQLALCAMQFCHWHTHHIDGITPRVPRALRSHHNSFMAEIRPGDELTILAQIVDSNEMTTIFAGQLLKTQAASELSVPDKPVICTLAIMEVYLIGD